MNNKFLKTNLISTLVLSLLLGSANIANADSGSSALPSKDSALHESYYRLYAPKTQTTFKEFATASQPVANVLKQNNDILLIGGAVTGGGALANIVKGLEKVPYVGTGVRVATGLGGGLVLVGTYGIMSYDDFKKGSIVKHKIYFKWSNAARLEYDVKVESWVEYKGTKVTSLKTTNYSKTL